MIYADATDLFRLKFDKENLIPLFRDLRNREINPEIWDMQTKFWTSLISKWGNQYNVIDFSVNQLSQSFEFNDVIPNIRPSIDILVKTKVIMPREKYLAKRSIFNTFATKLFGFASSSQQSDIFIFTNNLKQLVKKIISDIDIQASFSIDVIITNEEIKNKYGTKVDYEYLRHTLENTESVKAYSTGFYFKTDRFNSLSSDYVSEILKTKLILSSIDKQLNDIDKEKKMVVQRALQYKKQNMKTSAKNCIRNKLRLEARENSMRKMRDDLSNILYTVTDNELNTSVVDNINKIHQNLKKMQIPDVASVEDLMDDFNDTMHQSEELTNTFDLLDNKINDSEIEDEFNELMKNESFDSFRSNETTSKAKAVSSFQYKPVNEQPYLSFS